MFAVIFLFRSFSIIEKLEASKTSLTFIFNNNLSKLEFSSFISEPQPNRTVDSSFICKMSSISFNFE